MTHRRHLQPLHAAARSLLRRLAQASQDWRACRPGALSAPQASGQVPGWCVGWASLAGPHHANQDCAGATWHHRPGRGVHAPGWGVHAAVADGVTHGAAGDVAAAALARHWLRGPAAGQSQSDFLAQADRAVAQALAALGPAPGAATGAACWLGPDGRGTLTRIGDCRALLAQRNACDDGPAAWRVLPVTTDQSYAAQMAQMPQYADLPPEQWPAGIDPDQPACMAGIGRVGTPETFALALQPGDVLLLCSDGLHSVLDTAEPQALFDARLPSATAAASAHTLLALAHDLVQTAALRGSDDDITALLLARCGG